MTTTTDSRGPRRWRRRGATVVTLLAIGALAGCQSQTSEGSGGGTDSSVLSEAAATVKQASAEVTSGVPESSPPALKRKSVVLIPCAQAGEGCAQPAAGAKAAAEALGWKATVIDGKGTADGQSAAILQAISLKPDGIVTFAVDPSSVKGAVERARKAGIKIVASSSPPSDLVDFADNPTKAAWVKTGEIAADLVISKSEGRAKVALLTDKEFAAVNQRTDAFAARIGKCGGCELVGTSNFNFSELGTGVPQLAQQIARRNPGLNAVYVPYDAAVPPVLQGLKAVGATDVMVISGDGTSQAIQCIREKCGQTATVAFALDWIGWADIDAMNRLLQGKDPAPAAEQVPVKLITAENVPAQPGTWNGDLDFRPKYRQLWGIG